MFQSRDSDSGVELNSLVLSSLFHFRLTELCKKPLPHLMVKIVNLFNELNIKQKRAFANAMGITYKTDSLFANYVHKKFIKNQKRMDILGLVLITIHPIFSEQLENISPSSFIDEEENIVKEYGLWHFYWGLFLYPVDNAIITNRMHSIEREYSIYGLEEPMIILPESESRKPDELKREKENGLVAKERQLRIKAQEELAGLRKELRAVGIKLSKLEEEKTYFSQKASKSEEISRQLQESLEQERRKYTTLEREKKESLSELKDIQRLVKEHNDLKDSLKNMERERLEFFETLELLNTYCFELSPVLNGLNTIEAEPIRQPFFSIAEKVNHLMMLSGKKVEMKSEQTEEQEELRLNESFDAPLNFNPLLAEPLQDNKQSDSPSFNGTFYRKDHGGFIQTEMENGFNIPESIVLATGLEHEAEVECTVLRRPDGSMHHKIKILLQGDDSKAPITRHLGYIRLGENNVFQCVDIHDQNKCYPIHEKDVAMQNPNDDDPCIFNVGHGLNVARISQLYQNVERYKTDNTQLLKIRRSEAGTEPAKKEKKEKFLKGSKIVIVGGMAKWFQSVVDEAGAELYHENGESADRIYAKLQRANALFLLLTATSHEASWGSVEVAKSAGIPIYKIEGSKSNLRSLLWEHREEISSSRNTVMPNSDTGK